MELVLCLIPLEEGGMGELHFINAPASLIRNSEGGEETGGKMKGGKKKKYKIMTEQESVEEK